ncbi:hypothetical protein DS745_17940 [Anaerobacillus alkaliphilus]|uniref:Uncharacterized protein n=1 Tax=Anaerobacillus alkaliphilus TaxID=1548597 RepID=A0A4Q0VPP6_9BACI|nr:hypothetical protein [Anaerobacillus alkaliphilus]RXI98218.1 hypothetical protein DS745_17940 [Anaerobacillus alkaliphilus]
MKKKKIRKVDQVEPKVEEVKEEQIENQEVHPFAAWDNLMFMRRRPAEKTLEEESLNNDKK